MHTGLKTAFRPCLERFEPRIVAAGGGLISAAAAAHHAAPHHAAHVASHHASHPQAHLAPLPGTATPAAGLPSSPPSQPPPPPPALPRDTTTGQAWVELVNMTGQDLEYQIKLGPYAGGQFLPFDIAAGASQYRAAGLISGGQRVNADFAIQFGNGPVTPLDTGIARSSARGYYIFLDSNLHYYVSPFIRS